MAKKQCRKKAGPHKGQFVKCRPAKKKKSSKKRKANKGSCTKGSKRTKCSNIGLVAKFVKANRGNTSQKDGVVRVWKKLNGKNNGWSSGKSVKEFLEW